MATLHLPRSRERLLPHLVLARGEGEAVLRQRIAQMLERDPAGAFTPERIIVDVSHLDLLPKRIESWHLLDRSAKAFQVDLAEVFGEGGRGDLAVYEVLAWPVAALRQHPEEA